MAKNKVFPIIKKTIEKELKVKKILKNLKIQVDDSSPLDVSYCDQVLNLIGLPPEADLKDKNMNWDPFIDDYTAMVYGDVEIDKTLKKWEKSLTKIKINYNPKNHKKEIVNFLQKEQNLVRTLKTLGINQGPLYSLIEDWNLVYAVLGQEESEKLNNLLFETLEQDGDVQALVKKVLK